MKDNKLIIYKNSDGNIIVDAIYKDETLWLSQKGMSKVFNVGVPAISKHLKNIFAENELDKNSVVSKMEITQFNIHHSSLKFCDVSWYFFENDVLLYHKFFWQQTIVGIDYILLAFGFDEFQSVII